jgi:hypothetical protein
MKYKSSIVLLFTLIFGKSATAQSFEGMWKGTSLCQVKNSPCHDEIVVYHISKDNTGESYEMIANKIINGKEEYMGTIPFTYNEQQKVYVSIDSVANARWEFKITGNAMKGTLVYKGDLYRVVDVKKEN